LKKHSISVLFLILTLFALASSTTAEECSDSVAINNVNYPVTSRWCGRRIDSSMIADPSTLVPLPQELALEDRRIYVLPQVREALVKMAADAKIDGAKILVASGFRSVRYQRELIQKRLDRGQRIQTIFRYVAPPGYSEHHTGRALDLSPGGVVFGETRAYRWLKENAGDYGFVESIPQDSTNDEDWEPWHWYYNGDLPTP